jgi:hypothetical protein
MPGGGVDGARAFAFVVRLEAGFLLERLVLTLVDLPLLFFFTDAMCVLQ